MAYCVQPYTAQAPAAPTSSTLAMRVFETVELMEVGQSSRYVQPALTGLKAILSYLGPCDVLRAMQVVRCMRDTVNGSSKIQRSIGLLPDEHAHFQHDLWEPIVPSDQLTFGFHGMDLQSYRGTYRSFRGSRSADLVIMGVPPADLFVDAAFTIVCPPGGIFFTSALEKLGPRCRQMLPCQPPLKQIRTVTLCAHCASCPVRIETIKAEPKGHITLGVIQDAVLRARLAHRKKCTKPKARSEATVVMDCRTGKLAHDDPLMVQRKEETKRWEMNGGVPGNWDYDKVLEDSESSGGRS